VSTQTNQSRAELAAAVLAEEERRHAEQAARVGASEPADLDDLDALLGARHGDEDASLPSMVRAGGAATIATLFSLNLLDELDRAALSVLGPDIQRSLGMSDAMLGLVASVGGFMVFLAAVPIGYLADRRSRTKIVAACTLLWCAAGVLVGLVRSTTQLLLTRTISGIGKANEGPAQKAILADAYPLAGRNRIFALHNLANPIGVALGPALAAGIATVAGGADGWRWSFVVLTIPAVAAGVLAFRLREPARGGNEQAALGFDVLDPTDPTLITAISEGDEAPGLGAAFVRLRSIDTFRYLLFAFGALGFGLFATPVFVNLVLEDEYGLDAAGRGIVGSIVALGAIVGTIAGGRYGDELFRTSPERAVQWIAASVASLAITFPLAVSMPNAAGYTVVSLVTAAFISFAFVPATSLVAAITPYRLRSMGFAMMGVYLSLIGGVGGAVTAGLLSDATSPRMAILLLLPPASLVGGGLLAYGSRFVRADIARSVADLREEREEARRRASGRVEPALQIRHLDFSYGHVQVLFDVSIDVRQGEVLALLGTNGAGKSTLLRAVSALSPVDRGTIRHHGRDVTYADAGARLRAGIVQVPGGKAVFPSLSVAENLLVGAYTYIWERDRLTSRVGETLELFPVLRERLDQPAGTLSGGEQQMLALAKALLLEPDVLCIDELSLGLAPVVVQELIQVVEQLKARGLTIVVVEQSLNVALAIADRAVFMEKGRVRFEGPAQELAERGDLARAVFLGGEEG
jgi:ABC-type branched-subunit amino acid transport system ATPase component/predicted MFS family arabinose efflux permease